MMTYSSPDRPQRAWAGRGRTIRLLQALIPILLALSPFIALLILAAAGALPQAQGGLDLRMMGP